MGRSSSARTAIKYISMLMVCILLVGSFPRVNLAASVGLVNYYPYRPVEIMDAGGRLKASIVSQEETIEDTGESYLLAEISKLEILSAANTLGQIDSEELAVVLVALCVLKNANMEEEIYLTEELAEKIYEDSILTVSDTGEPYKLEAETALTIEVLLNAYLLSGSENIAEVLLSHLYSSNNRFNKDVKYITKKLKTVNTRYGEHTTVYDLYLMVNELLQYEAFVNCMGADYIEFEYIPQGGESATLRCDRQGTYEDYSTIIPENYRQAGRINNDILIIADVEERYYLAVTSGCDMATVTEALPVVVLNDATAAGAPIPEKAIVPTESNEARYEYIFGEGTPVEYYTMENKPKGYETAAKAKRNMKTISVPVWKMDSAGNKYASTYSLTVHKNLVESVKCIYDEIFELSIKFPIKYMIGYSYRKVGGVGLKNSRLMSVHSFGAAIDINPGDYDNDYYLGQGNDLRDKSNPYCIPDEVIQIFERYGWFWGGDFKICADTMHFQYLGLDFLDYVEDDEFPVLKYTYPTTNNKYVSNLQKRLAELNYLDEQDITGTFGLRTRRALVEFQKEHGIEASGETDYITWETIINLTHYLQYEF